jgi:hypothetical protein
MELAPLLIDDNLRASLGVVNFAKSASPGMIELDGRGVVTIQPVGLCMLGVAAKIASHKGGVLRISGLPRSACEVLSNWGASIELVAMTDAKEADLDTLTGGIAVRSAADANQAANELANQIAQFVPNEDKDQMLRDGYDARIHSAIQPALAHILSELVDNVFSHAATVEFRNPHAWLAVQTYRNGDLMRVAVVDDGCGLLGSLRGLYESPPKSHFDAAVRAFEPFVSSKSAKTMYTERRHMGLGLTVCRELCKRLDGTIYTATGNAWVTNPGLSNQSNRLAEPFFQGTAISLEFHRRAVTSRTLRDAISNASQSPNLRLRFDRR